MNLKVSSTISLGVIVSLLTGCTLLPLKRIQPLIAPPEAPACNEDTKVRLFNEDSDKFGHVTDAARRASDFGYLLPGADSVANGRSVRATKFKSFSEFDNSATQRVNDKLGARLAGDPVVRAFTAAMVSVSAEAQLDAQIADGTTSTNVDVQAEFEQIRQKRVTPKLNHVQLKKFANLLYETQLKHTAADYVQNAVPNKLVVAAARAGKSALTQTSTAVRLKFDDALIAYLKAYYSGKFYDRMGTAISKPQLPDKTNLLSSLSNFSVPDSEITAAETVMLEFLMDTLDPTPVLGDTKCPVPTTALDASCQPAQGDPTSTTYYPGNSSNQPTALAVGLAKYVELPAQGCGFTTKNVWVLQSLANGASDEAGTVSGLIANTAGGLGVSLGVFGKISIGDNATLSDLVKTAASELGLRTTLLASYFSLYRVNFTPLQSPELPALVPSMKMLVFSYKSGDPTTGAGATPLTQSVHINDPAGAALIWTASSNESWLTFSPAQQSGSSGAVLVSVDPSGLKPQTYRGAISLTPQKSTAGVATIAVTFTVSPTTAP